MRNTLQPSDGPADGDETLVVHARTGSGDVVVQRATGPARGLASGVEAEHGEPAGERLELVGVPSRTNPERFAKPTPTGTSTAKLRSTGPASLGAEFDDLDPSRSAAAGQRARTGGTCIGRPVGAGIAGDGVQAAVVVERCHRGAARLAGLRPGTVRTWAGPVGMPSLCIAFTTRFIGLR